jgi:hypothetical protein
MNIAMEQTEEYVDDQLKAKYGDCFIRGNNGTCRTLLYRCMLNRIVQFTPAICVALVRSLTIFSFLFTYSAIHFNTDKTKVD